jgi:hypothetical protein
LVVFSVMGALNFLLLRGSPENLKVFWTIVAVGSLACIVGLVFLGRSRVTYFIGIFVLALVLAEVALATVYRFGEAKSLMSWARAIGMVWICFLLGMLLRAFMIGVRSRAYFGFPVKMGNRPAPPPAAKGDDAGTP